MRGLREPKQTPAGFALASETGARRERQRPIPAARLAALYDAAPVGYFTLGEAGQILEANRTGAELLGWKASWLSGHSLQKWVLAKDAPLFENHLLTVASTGAAAHRLGLKNRSGRVRDVLLQSRLAEAADDGARCFTVVIDLSEHLRSEREARVEQAKLMHASRLNTMGEMASSLAHELNQPLGAILLNANACLQLLDGESTTEVDRLRTTLSLICESAAYAGGVIRHLRGFLRLSDGVRENVDLNALVREAMRMMAPDARDHDTHIAQELAAPLPCAFGDPVQMEQVLLNLVRNSIDAMRDSTLRRITVRTMKWEGDAVAFSVSDTGPGISPKVARRLFEPMFTTKADGMGLGLSISRTIVESHMGRLWWADDLGPGATFICKLPTGIGESP
jgi:PAS domain S-box-containing protein